MPFCFLQEMVARKTPWKGLQGVQIVLAVAKENTRLKIPDDCDPVLKNIITSVWRAKPEKRYPTHTSPHHSASTTSTRPHPLPTQTPLLTPANLSLSLSLSLSHIG